MSAKFELDAREFTETMRQYAKFSKKDEEQIVQDRAGKLAFELFKQFRAVAPSVAKIRALPRQLNHRIRRKFKGATIKQEIARRIRARFSAAIGWIPAVNRLTKRRTAIRKKNPKGTVVINLSEPSVTITNDMKEGVAAEARHRIMQSAVNAQVADMTVYINRKLDQRAKQFSAK
jgi:hypothetical protein